MKVVDNSFVTSKIVVVDHNLGHFELFFVDVVCFPFILLLDTDSQALC